MMMQVRSLTIAAALCAGLTFLGGCNRQPETQAQAPTQVTPYDLSAESNAKYLADNAAKEGVTKHQTGLQYRVLKTGTGITPTSGYDVVTVSYTGTLIDGTKFDGTDPGDTVEFEAGALIPGWVIALSMMKEGDQWELVIPSELGYGAEGAGGDPLAVPPVPPVIPPNQTLIFVMELHKVVPATQAAPGEAAPPAQ
jgi:FKBP-type peptidyl-prolyl cis-trans isomerase